MKKQIQKENRHSALDAESKSASARLLTFSSQALRLAVVLVFLSAPALASDAPEIAKQQWPHKGLTGTYDKAAVQRGFQVYKEVCAACHSMKYLSYRNLQELGYTEAQVKAIASEYTIRDGPNDDGEMFDRPGRPSDRFASPFANDKAARAANGGALPPDLSLIVKARPHGEDYIFALLTGYAEAPEDVQMNAGMSYNKAFTGHQIAMAQPLMDGQVSYSDGTPNSLEREAHDVSQFLTWASEPYQDERKRMGVKVVLFLLSFAAVLYAVKRKVWSSLK